MDAAKFQQEAPSLFLPLSAVCLFVMSYALAIFYRRAIPLHARRTLTYITPFESTLEMLKQGVLYDER